MLNEVRGDQEGKGMPGRVTVHNEEDQSWNECHDLWLAYHLAEMGKKEERIRELEEKYERVVNIAFGDSYDMESEIDKTPNELKIEELEAKIKELQSKPTLTVEQIREEIAVSSINIHSQNHLKECFTKDGDFDFNKLKAYEEAEIEKLAQAIHKLIQEGRK